jgi:hypothetical protein
MSESALPLAPEGGAAVAPLEEPEADNKRRLIMLVGGVALLLLVVAGYFLFMRGGSSDSSSSGLVATHHATKSSQAAGKPATSAAKTVPSTFNNVLARDPFKPLYVAPPPPAVAPAAGATSTTSTATTSTASSASQPVTLVKVYSKNGKSYAQTKVGNTLFTPTVGQTFGGTFQLLSISGKAATYVQGDEQFSLSVGQVVLK